MDAIEKAIDTLEKVKNDYEAVDDCYCVLCESIRMKDIRKLLEKEGKLRGKITSIL